MAFPKHEATKTQRKGKKQQQPPASENITNVVATGPMSDHTGKPRSMQHDINHIAGMDGIEGSLDNLVSAVARLTHDDHTVGLTLCAPIKLTLADNDEEDTMGRFVTALERIADSIARLAGLTRPRLESWHEQEEYEPRYKATACDGGAPGPKTT